MTKVYAVEIADCHGAAAKRVGELVQALKDLGQVRFRVLVLPLIPAS